MTCVLDILSIEDLYIRKEHLLKQLKKVDDEIIKRNIKKETSIFKEEIIKLIKVKKKSSISSLYNKSTEMMVIPNIPEFTMENQSHIEENLNPTLFSEEHTSSENNLNECTSTSTSISICLEKIDKKHIRIKVKKK